MPGGVSGVKGRSQGKSGRPKQVPRAKWVSLSQAADQIRQAVKRNPKERQVTPAPCDGLYASGGVLRTQARRSGECRWCNMRSVCTRWVEGTTNRLVQTHSCRGVPSRGVPSTTSRAGKDTQAKPGQCHFFKGNAPFL